MVELLGSPRLDAGPLANAHDWLGFYEQFWTARLKADYDKRFPA